MSKSSLPLDFPTAPQKDTTLKSSCWSRNPSLLSSHVTYNWSPNPTDHINYPPSYHLHHYYLVQDTFISCLDYCNSILIVHPSSILVHLLRNLHTVSRAIFLKIIHLFHYTQKKFQFPTAACKCLKHWGPCLSHTPQCPVCLSVLVGMALCPQLKPGNCLRVGSWGLPRPWTRCVLLSDLLWPDFSLHSELCQMGAL